ncbi:hypothetical protein [Desertibacillus haloalkaliphilus]|uniref:hypothetical protein n=1 Tax=Desertibacillus haloalkaliphilus TaxID=1328930 RepID=UPI001C274505|nr:hypothetical protein [Desertibacillus haloalkaliphilus]MBU8905586.1 hypothetical protein [Desertibacillus haloalkaliphilus]
MITLSQEQSLILQFHLSVMRGSVKKGFKKTYGFKYREKMKLYDEVIKKLQSVDQSLEVQEYNLSIDEVEMLNQFLGFYITELESNLSGDGQDEDQKDILHIINDLKEMSRKFHEYLAN